MGPKSKYRRPDMENKAEENEAMSPDIVCIFLYMY